MPVARSQGLRRRLGVVVMPNNPQSETDAKIPTIKVDSGPRPAGALVMADPRSDQKAIILQVSEAQPKQWLESYQTLTVGFLTFVVAVLTAINAIWATRVNQRNRAEDLDRKRAAFFAVAVSDIERVSEQIEKVTDIVKSVDVTESTDDSWNRALRVASRDLPSIGLTDDWEKLSILNREEIKNLRLAQVNVLDIAKQISAIIDSPLAMRMQGVLPFDASRRINVVSDSESLTALYENLVETLDEVKSQIDQLRLIFEKEL